MNRKLSLLFGLLLTLIPWLPAEAATPCIKHTTQSSAPDIGGSAISSGEWNECHTVENNAIVPANIDKTQPYTWSGNNTHSGTNRFTGTLEADAVTPAQITADQNDYAGCAGKIVCRITLDTDRMITSLSGGGNWRWLEIYNIDPDDDLTLEHDSASGTSANRILSTTGNNLIIGPGQSALCRYDNVATRWRCIPSVSTIGSEADTLQTVFDRPSGNRISGATESKPFSLRGASGATSDDGWDFYIDSLGRPQGKCVVNEVRDDCDYYRQLASGKKGGYTDSLGAVAALEFQEGVGVTRMGPGTQANGDEWRYNGTIWAATKRTHTVELVVFDFTTAITTGDGKFYFVIPPQLNGTNLIGIRGHVITVSSSGAINVDVDRCAVVATGNTCSGTVVDVLSTNLTIDANESKSATAAAAAVINAANDDVATDQVYRINVDGAGTGAQGLIVVLEFQLP